MKEGDFAVRAVLIRKSEKGRQRKGNRREQENLKSKTESSTSTKELRGGQLIMDFIPHDVRS
jgi:hypothetical protein